MSKKTIGILVLVMVLVLATTMGAGILASAVDASPMRTVRIKVAHISDVHTMIESYGNPYSATFQSADRGSKMLSQTEAAAETAFEMVFNEIAEQAEVGALPTYLVISGDNTSNGELANAMYLADCMKRYTKRIRAIAGYEKFQMFIVPGNHDLFNERAISYMPSQEELDACANAEERLALLTSYTTRSVPTTTSLDFMTIYSDFGYCNCPGRAEGTHLAECGMADGCKLEFFYESDYWYDNTTTRSVRPEELGTPLQLVGELNRVVVDGVEDADYTYTHRYTSEGLDPRPLGTADQTRFKNSGKNFTLIEDEARFGACSYIARMDDVVVAGLDTNARKYVGIEEGDSVARITSLGWNETTGGYVSDRQLKWVTESINKKDVHGNSDVSSGKTILGITHVNVLPHFDTEDEVISLFTLDNWEQGYTTMADNGLRYVFTGHQHTNDAEYMPSQKGNVLFDFEGSSTATVGSSYRMLDFTVDHYEDGHYTEDVTSNIHYLKYNAQVDGKDVFVYPAVKMNEDGSLTKVPTILSNKEGEYVALSEFLGAGLKTTITTIANDIVNESLMDMLRDLLSGLEGGEVTGKIYPLAMSAVDQLDTLNLKRFTKNADGTFTLSDNIEEGYHLTRFAMDLVDYVITYDFGYTMLNQKATLDDILAIVYGGHTSGAIGTDPVPELDPLLENLENGTFVKFVVDVLYRGLLPELEIILRAPIYWGDSIQYTMLDDAPAVTAADVANGKGFDLSAVAAPLFDMSFEVGPIKLEVGKLIGENADISSLYNLLRSLPNLQGIVDSALPLLPISDSIKSIVGTAFEYLGKLDEYDTLCLAVKEELLDKYVTDAFCKNLGNYGAYVIGSFLYDDSEDGAHKIDSTSNFPYEADKDTHHLVFENGVSVYTQGQRPVTYNSMQQYTPYTRLGVIADRISMAHVITDDKVDTTAQKIAWFTAFDRDINAVTYNSKTGNGALDSIHHTLIKVATSEAALASAGTTQVTGENVLLEYPTIDLGITYLNMTYAVRVYNAYEYTLTGLTPDTTYYYQIGSYDPIYGENDSHVLWGDVYSFRTRKESGGFGFAAITDIQGSVEKNYIDSAANMRLMLETLAGKDIGFVVNCGDNVDYGKNINQWGWLLNHQDFVWGNYVNVGVAGNHEKKEYGASTMITLPDILTKGSSKWNETGYYYSYDYQNVHFVILNTNDLAKNGALSSQQTSWLQSDLSQAQEDTAIDYTIVMLHKGPYTAGSHAFDTDVIALRNQLSSIFASYGVDVVLQGHDHTYSVSAFINEDGEEVAPTVDALGRITSANDGVLYINLGTMGDKFYNYIYSEEVTLLSRASDNVNPAARAFVTESGALEITENPVFSYIEVDEGALCYTSYVIVDGKAELLDRIVLSKTGTPAISTNINVLGADYTGVLSAVKPAILGDTNRIYSAYPLADVLRVKGEAAARFCVDGTCFDANQAYVVVAEGESASSLTALADAKLLVYGADGLSIHKLENMSAAKGASQGLEAWVIAVIAVGAVAVVLAIVLPLVLRKKKVVSEAVAQQDEQSSDNE